MSHTATIYRYLGSDPISTEVEVEYRFVKRSVGGWYVNRTDNGRELGWLYPVRDRWDGPIKGWEGRLAEGAFRGEGPDDTGYVLDAVPGDLFGGDSNGTTYVTALGRTREEVAQELIQRLDRKLAPAVGHGPHFRVRRYNH